MTTPCCLSGAATRVDRHPGGLHQAGARLQARHHLHRRPEAPPHSAILVSVLENFFCRIDTP